MCGYIYIFYGRDAVAPHLQDLCAYFYAASTSCVQEDIMKKRRYRYCQSAICDFGILKIPLHSIRECRVPVGTGDTLLRKWDADPDPNCKLQIANCENSLSAGAPPEPKWQIANCKLQVANCENSKKHYSPEPPSSQFAICNVVFLGREASGE